VLDGVAACCYTCRDLPAAFSAPYSSGPALRARYDNEPYKVHRRHRESQKAAELLARVNTWVSMVFLRHLRRKYKAAVPDEKGGAPLRLRDPRAQIVHNILRRYRPNKLIESSPNNPQEDTSYTINKGQVLAICLREKGGKGGFHDFTTIRFVKVHELAHLGIDKHGHPPEFWSCFKFLLQESQDLVKVIPGAKFGEFEVMPRIEGWPDYVRHPINYCGLHVDYNPLYDPRVPLPA